jgi:hypothetical protein
MIGGASVVFWSFEVASAESNQVLSLFSDTFFGAAAVYFRRRRRRRCSTTS